ncbi:MAG TPA: Calx-beta domain-containing protein [Gammaproteobacteria bacterium]|nr:Calx-beta domain-containing protein [Gammaproteobacteria bacterium]
MDTQNARLGTRIGDRFVLEEVLDHVPFGSAYRAIDTRQSAERHVTLWLLPWDAGKNVAPDVLHSAFGRVRALKGPGIGRVYELGRWDDRYFISGELVDGETLRNVLDHLRPERLDEHEAASIVRAVGAALAYAHDCDVAHGEVRAENVVVTMRLETKLVNFMASRLLRLETAAASATGDVRDLAALAHELYTGERLETRDKPRAKAPKRVARAIEAALHSGRHGLTVREFLEAAGLDELEAPVETAPPRRPVAAADLDVELVAMDRIDPVELARPKRPRRSMWRFAVPFMALGGLAVALHQTGGVDALLAAGRQIKTVGAGLIAPPPAEDKAMVRESAPPEPTNPVQASLAGVPAPSLVPPSPPPEPKPPVLSFASATIKAREGQSMLTLAIVRTSGDGPASVVWWTTDDTAHAREDYASFGKRVERFAPEDNGRRIIIPIVSDSLREATEHFQVHIAAASEGTRIGAIDTVDVTLLDDDDS